MARDQAALAEQQLRAAEERIANGDDAYDLLEGVQLTGLLDDSERITRAYLSLVRLLRVLQRRHSNAARLRQPEPEPEPESKPGLRVRSRIAPLCTGFEDGAEADISSVGSAASLQDMHELETNNTAARGNNPVSLQHVPAPAHGADCGVVRDKLLAGMQVIPRLQLAEGLRGHDVTSGPRTRSSRRVSASARRSLESTRGTPSNTGRSLRSVRLDVQEDTVRSPAVGLVVPQGSGYVPTASNHLQLLAARAAGVFMARRTAGIVSNMRDRNIPTAHHAGHKSTQCVAQRHGVYWRSQHCIVNLMTALTTFVLDSSRSGVRCGLDIDVVQLPINALVGDLISTAHRAVVEDGEFAVPNSYRAAVLLLCCQIGSVVDKWALSHDAAADTALPPDAVAAPTETDSNRNAVLAVLPGGTASVDTTPSPAENFVNAKADASPRRDRFVLRLARILKDLVYADTLERHLVSRCLSLLKDYIKLCPARVRQTRGLIKTSLRHISGRTFSGREFDASIHLNHVEVVHCLLALSDVMLDPSTDWLVMEKSTANWIGAYCFWVFTVSADASNFSYSVGQMQSQAIRFIIRCSQAYWRRHAYGMSLTAGTSDPMSEVTVYQLISSAIRQDPTASITSGLERAKAALDLLVEATLPGRDLRCILRGNFTTPMYCACMIFLRAYFQPSPRCMENATLCCAAIKTILLLLEVDSTSAVEQIEQLGLVDVLVGEISSEYLCDQKKTVLSFTTVSVSSNGHASGYGSMLSGEIADNSNACVFESDDESYSSDSDSLDSRYSPKQSDSYSRDEKFIELASSKTATSALHLSDVLAGSRLSDTAAEVVPAAALAADPAGVADAAESTVLGGRRVYERDELHLLVLQLVIALVVTSDGLLIPKHWSRTPAAEGKPDLHDLLYGHLNNARNRHLVAELEKRILSMPCAEGAVCLLKLLCADMFDATSYTDRTRLASGANATVYRCNRTVRPQDGQRATHPQVVALKVIDRSSSANHFCPLPDVFSEIRVLMRLHGCEGACQLIDYGVGSDSYYIALKCYTTSLRKWRLHQDTRSTFPHHQHRLLSQYLHIYRRILLVADTLAIRNIIHFDIKCDNVLVSPAENTDLSDFWEPTPNAILDYDVVLADFGVGKLVGQSDGMYTVRNRGTECIKSPEMIMADSTSNKAHPSYDRRRVDGSTTSSDVWSLGCLLYEREPLPRSCRCVYLFCVKSLKILTVDRGSGLCTNKTVVTGKFLFDDNDFSRFFARVCSESGEPIITDSDRQRLNDPRLAAFLEFVLVRDPTIRPSIEDVRRRFDMIFPETSAASHSTV